ncbi:MAG: oleate hydratase, partial [Ignavibacteria bacterium]
MKRVIVIGGGIAGISAASYLDRNNFEITLIESSPQLGGRVKSFYDDYFKSYLDNGQHLLIRGYECTLDLIRKFKANDNFIFQKEFNIHFRDRINQEWYLKISTPITTLFNFLKFKNLNFRERISLLKFFLQLRNADNITTDLTVLDFLRKCNQDQKVINNFWKLIVESALNTPIEKSSAKVFLFVLKKMFVENKSNSCLVIPQKSLYESLIIPAENYLTERGVSIIKSCGIERITINNDYITEIVDRSGKIYKEDY